MEISPFIHRLKQSCLHFLYPSRCLHCENPALQDPFLLCPSCLLLLELMNPDNHCKICFNKKDLHKGKYCLDCLQGKQNPLFQSVASAFEYAGPVISLVKKMKYANQPYLADIAGAFLVAQMEELQWPLPDAIIPVPLSFTHWLERGYNQSHLIAKQMSKLLGIPVWNVLKRSSGDFSQTGLNLLQRKALKRSRFKLKKNFYCEGKILLLVDDVFTTGATLKRCAEVLVEEKPAALYGLTFCRAL